MLVFLDIDGVLRRLDSEPWRFDQDCLANFEDVIRRFSAIRIVISSSWRLDYSLDALKEFFSTDIALSIVGVTPEAQRITKYYRYHEVATYLKQTQQTQAPWVAVDDDPEHFPDDCTVVITDSLRGFDPKAAGQLRQLLQTSGIADVSHCAVIPFIREGPNLKVVLITSKHSGSWTYPKGVIETHIPIYGTAAIEAFEEAGCRGQIYPVPIGRYTDGRDGRNRTVLVYVMEVVDLLEKWEEAAIRRRSIVSVHEAHPQLNNQNQVRMLARVEEFIETSDRSRWLTYDLGNRIRPDEFEFQRHS